ncbi:NAD-dependent epimerase/dehydratase family protein [Tautonia sociabilis]|uniref:NAD-dependent epimerase/dehydratase family protein n=1 Tax=Tautonia sociabilis TaxID=2080755 RepID=A0A432MHG5_9BACT|nr:NAD-dependent epimerase/dehydratase family protein [Tautonia sociabilis]RUL86740.1 NAD-dependent epimerase/dehydratase family protein [Tautonia sociabilis]
MPVWLVSGGSGFLGLRVLDLLRGSPENEVVAIGRRLPSGWPPEAFVRADLEDPPSVARAVKQVRPEFVLHLAGRTPPAAPADFYRTNVGGTVGLLRALEGLGTPIRVVTAGSAAEYGPVPSGLLPIGEETPCRPEGPYGLSKWFASNATAGCRGPVEGVVARIFNPIGPGMPRSQAFGRFAAELAEAGPGPMTLRTGALDSRRDFIDVRDVASALLALATRGKAGSSYPVGSGSSRSIREGLDRLVALSRRRVAIEATGSVIGPTDSRADPGAIRRDTGWSPRIPFERSLADLWASAAVASGPDRPTARLDAGSSPLHRAGRPPGVPLGE